MEAFAHLPVGSRFPDVDLPDMAGNPWRLADVAAGDPVVLTTYRGWWCPREQAWMRRLASWQDEVEVASARVASISVDPPEVAAAYRAGLGARWLFLCDPERRWLDRLGLRETTDTAHVPYQPAVFVLRPDLEIAAAWNGYWYWGRPSTQALHATLRDVTRQVRADWEVPR